MTAMRRKTQISSNKNVRNDHRIPQTKATPAMPQVKLLKETSPKQVKRDK